MMNYINTFIQVAPDCPVKAAVVPPARGGQKTIPQLEYEMLSGSPYVFTQEEILFEVHARHKDIPESELKAHREELWAEFFSKSRACLRASSLPKHGVLPPLAPPRPPLHSFDGGVFFFVLAKSSVYLIIIIRTYSQH